MSMSENNGQRSAEYLEGLAVGFDEATTDRWTSDLARRYFELVGEPVSDFDAGHQEGIRQALERAGTTRSR